MVRPLTRFSLWYAHLFPLFVVSKDFVAQAGDPTATGTGGESAASYLASQANVPESSRPGRYFMPELVPRLKHTSKGTVSMAIAPSPDGKALGGCGSQFFITLGENIDYLDGKHAVFGHVVEGEDVLDKLSEVYVDSEGRPLKDVRIRHVIVLGELVLFSSYTLITFLIHIYAMLQTTHSPTRST